MASNVPATYATCESRIREVSSVLQEAAEALMSRVNLSACQELRLTDAIPHTDSPGVYLIFDQDQELLYIGKAERPLGLEVWSKFKRGDGDRVVWATGGPDQDQPEFIATIAIDHEHRYLAPALEGLLIRTLQPRQNSMGSGMPPTAVCR
jgi:hypothetical protein